LLPQNLIATGYDFMDTKGSGKSEFVRLVYGCHLSAMYGNADVDQMLIKAYRSTIAQPLEGHLDPDPEETAFVQEYVQSILPEGSFFEAPVLGGGAEDRMVFQMVSLHPERKATIERISQLGGVTWSNCGAIATMQADPNRDNMFGLGVSSVIPLNWVRFFRDGLHRDTHKFNGCIVQDVFDASNRQLQPIADLAGPVGALADALIAEPAGLTEQQLAVRLPGIDADALQLARAEMGSMLVATSGTDGPYLLLLLHVI
jgi:hypothetical protein